MVAKIISYMDLATLFLCYKCQIDCPGREGRLFWDSGTTNVYLTWGLYLQKGWRYLKRAPIWIFNSQSLLHSSSLVPLWPYSQHQERKEEWLFLGLDKERIQGWMHKENFKRAKAVFYWCISDYKAIAHSRGNWGWAKWPNSKYPEPPSVRLEIVFKD
jgi:hypothetical protein